MSVIAWDGFTLAADKRCTDGELKHRVTKIERFNSELIGVVGSLSDGLMLVDWYKNGAKKEDFPKSENGVEMIVIGKEIKSYMSAPIPVIVEETIYAVGSGRAYAMAALYLGNDAKTAVQVACQFDAGCGDGMDFLTCEEKT